MQHLFCIVCCRFKIDSKCEISDILSFSRMSLMIAPSAETNASIMSSTKHQTFNPNSTENRFRKSDNMLQKPFEGHKIIFKHLDFPTQKISKYKN